MPGLDGAGVGKRLAGIWAGATQAWGEFWICPEGTEGPWEGLSRGGHEWSRSSGRFRRQLCGAQSQEQEPPALLVADEQRERGGQEILGKLGDMWA